MPVVRSRTIFFAAIAALLLLAIHWHSSWTPPILDQSSDKEIYAPADGHTVEHTTQHEDVQETTADPGESSTIHSFSSPTDPPVPLSQESQTMELVLAKLTEEDTSWTDSLSDLMIPQGNLNLSVYVVDDPTAPLHPPENKGHEAMVYFTYLIDRYDSLPDISIFMHGHASTWHNNDLLNASSEALVRYLKPDSVQREGYMNLRCHWHPGCRNWIHPKAKDVDNNKQEQQIIARAWTELFDAPVPELLASPCCSQFAVSRDTLLKHPREFYEKIRTWILETDIPDHDSGRVFEYFWQYIFVDKLSLCPHPRICYCDGYGVCFEDEETYESFFALQEKHHGLWDEVEKWRKQRDRYEESRRINLINLAFPPDPNAEERWLAEIHELEKEMDPMKSHAVALGQDARRRAELVQLAWQQIGDERDWVDVSHKEDKK